jgi:hypothetical protein
MRKTKHRGISGVAADFAQPDRLQPDPHSQTDCGVGRRAVQTTKKRLEWIEHTKSNDPQEREKLQFPGFSADC